MTNTLKKAWQTADVQCSRKRYQNSYYKYIQMLEGTIMKLVKKGRMLMSCQIATINLKNLFFKKEPNSWKYNNWSEKENSLERLNTSFELVEE